MTRLAVLLGVACAVFWWLLFARIVLSWLDPFGRSRAAQFLMTVTEPVLAPVRSVVRPVGGLDLASVAVLIVTGLIWRTLL